MNESKKYAVFTIDIERFEDTECVAKSGYTPKDDMLDGVDKYINILNKHNIKATMFALSDAANRIEDKLKKYIDMGHKLAIHGGNTHRPATELSDAEFEKEIKKTKSSFEETYGVPVKGYRAPFFGIDKRKLKILQSAGFTYDSSRLDFSGARYHENMDMHDYENPMDEIYKKDGFYEFGLCNQKIFGCNFPISGGGYMRLANWGMIKSILNDYIKKHNYYVFYLHPFELSNKKIPQIHGIKSYDKMYLQYGLFSMPRKIEKIIKMLKRNGYTFITFDELTEQIN